jgi:glycosyltransferase involved in cell wall biosynthesis
MSDDPVVVMVGDFDPEHPRETYVRRSLDRLAVGVRECRFRDDPLFIGVRKLLLLPYFYLLLVRRMQAILAEPVDVRAVYVSKFNPLVLPVGALYARRLGCPLVYDIYVSLSVTAEMRGYAAPLVRLVHLVERLAYRLPTHILVGTDHLADRYADIYGVPRERFVRLPPAADDERFHPRDLKRREPFTALYWGNFLPHHGMDVIADAARALDGEGVEVVFLGTGPEHDRIEAEIGALDHVRFEGFVPREDLHRWIEISGVCLGVFSPHPRALASLTNKVCEAAASGKAIVTERSPAMAEWFEHGESVHLVEPGDPDALAAAIRTLRDDPEAVARLEAGARAVHEREFTVERGGEILAPIVGAETPEDG